MRTCRHFASAILLCLGTVAGGGCGDSTPVAFPRDASSDPKSGAAEAFEVAPDRTLPPDAPPVPDQAQAGLDLAADVAVGGEAGVFDAADANLMVRVDAADAAGVEAGRALDVSPTEAGSHADSEYSGIDAGVEIRRDVAFAVDGGKDGPAPDGPVGLQVPWVSKLVPDPQAGLLYALSGNQLLVFDTALKQQVTKVALGANTTDLDLSPDGTLLVGAQDSEMRLVVVDKATWTTSYVTTREDPQQVEVMNGGIAYYATLDQGCEVHQVDLAWGKAGDVKLNLYPSYEPDLELSPTGDRLFVGESGLSSSMLSALDLTVTPTQTVDESVWDDGNGFNAPTRHVYLAPSGKHIYYADYQLDAKDMSRVLGNVGTVFAEDAAGTFAVSSRGLVDAELRTLIVPFAAHPTTAAALVRADSEVWYYDSNAERLFWVSTAELLAGQTLGVRVRPADDIKNYTFTKLVVDPVRPRLYGLDASHSRLVSIDSQTGQALGAAVIESVAKDVVIDRAGSYIYVGHNGTALEQIDATNLALVKYIFGPRFSYELAMLSGNRLASIDDDQWTEVTLIDPTSGKVVTSAYGSHEAALSVTADGNTLFVGDSRYSSALLMRYDLSAGKLVTVSTSDPYDNPLRNMIATPDGSRVFYAGYCLDGIKLTQRLYPLTDTIVSITPNSALAISATQIYRVSDGTALAPLAPGCPVQTLSPDGATLYCSDATGIRKVSLAGLQ